MMPLSAGLAGEKKKLCNVSPRPNCEPLGPAMSSCEVTGRMVREMTFQSAFSEKGMTGWMLTVALLPSSGP
ncbi:hypothetical protein D3C72_2289080 [compost metagenome]